MLTAIGPEQDARERAIRPHKMVAGKTDGDHFMGGFPSNAVRAEFYSLPMHRFGDEDRQVYGEWALMG